MIQRALLLLQLCLIHREVVNTAADMFSYGMLAFCVHSGKSLYQVLVQRVSSLNRVYNLAGAQLGNFEREAQIYIYIIGRMI